MICGAVRTVLCWVDPRPHPSYSLSLGLQSVRVSQRECPKGFLPEHGGLAGFHWGLGKLKSPESICVYQ